MFGLLAVIFGAVGAVGGRSMLAVSGGLFALAAAVGSLKRP